MAQTPSSSLPRLLITGGSGMVGRNLREHPDMKNWQVLAPSSRELDMRSKQAVHDYLATHKPEIVVHAAGVVGGIQANMAEPMRFLAANTEMGVNLISGCVAAGVPSVINLASTCMYPRDIRNPLEEDDVLTAPLEPTNEGYALAKIVTMRMCEYAMRENPALNYKTLIPCNLYGRHDKFDPKNSHMVPAVIHKIYQAKLDGVTEVEIWGDGEARREFMYAGDLTDAIVRALKDPASLPVSMNVGLGTDYTINEYYKFAAEVIGWDGTFVHDLSKPVGMRQKLSSSKRQTDWGWAPKTTLIDGLKATFQFYLEERQA